MGGRDACKEEKSPLDGAARSHCWILWPLPGTVLHSAVSLLSRMLYTPLPGVGGS